MIDRQMTGQSTTPFMKLTDKKRKTVTFDARDALEKTSKNMEKMMALMDKMYIKWDQKEVPYKPQIYQRGRGQNRQNLDKEIIGQDIDHLVETVLKVIEDMEELEVIFREVTFKVDLIIILVEFGKTEGHEDNLDQEKEKGGLGHHPVLDWDWEIVWTEIGLDVLNAENMTTLRMNVQI